MKKRDLRALAAMGLALGVMMSAQPAQANESSEAGHYLASKCGGGGKCSGASFVNYYPNQGQGQGHSCGGAPQGQGYYQGQGQGQSHSCGTPQGPQPGQPMPNGGYYGGVVSQGCHAQYPTNTGSNSGYQNGGYTADAEKTPVTTYQAPTDASQTKQAPVTDQDLRSNPDYMSLSPEGKALALKLANQTCKGKNDCAGLSSCKTSDHSCAGQNSCKGKSAGPFKDKNLAVKIAAQKMKRNQTNSPKSSY